MKVNVIHMGAPVTVAHAGSIAWEPHQGAEGMYRVKLEWPGGGVWMPGMFTWDAVDCLREKMRVEDPGVEVEIDFDADTARFVEAA